MSRRSKNDNNEDILNDSSAEHVALLHARDGINDEESIDGFSRLKERKSGREGKSSKYSFIRLRRYLQTRKKTVIFVVIVGFIAIVLSLGAYVYCVKPKYGESPPWYPTPSGGTLSTWQQSYQKAATMVSNMTLLEKVNITTGTGWAMGLCVGNTAPAIHVGFPALCLQDGPLGIRFADNITAFPAGLTTGATWNRTLMYNRGRAHGLEARLKGVNILLGPAMGPLGRMPAGGRNWEGFGADPVLQGVAAAQTIKGIQDEGVIATAKHFILNEQEHYRQANEWGIPNAVSSNVDDRTLHEIYLWPFAESVKAGVASIMCSYQMVNNSYACSNSKIMNGILKDELGFQGFVQSDWLAQRSGVASALAGLDMTMPGDGLWWANGDSLWGSKLTLAVLNGSLPISRLNDMATRVVAAWYQLGQDDTERFPRPPPEGEGGPNFSSWTRERVGLIHYGSGEGETGVVNKYINVQGSGDNAHGEIVRQVAAEGTVLLKNEGNILPLSRNGWGASNSAGLNRKFRVGIFGEDAGEGKGRNACQDRGCNTGTLASGWGSGAADFPYLITPAEALLSAFDQDEVDISLKLTNDLASTEDQNTLSSQDLCLAFINADAGEGFLNVDGIRGDRNDLYAQKGGDKLAKNVAENCGGGSGKTIVVVHSVGAVLVENWIDIDGVKALIFAHLPGQESGNALVDILFGSVNPSGKLPYTIGKSLQDYGEGGQVLYYPNGVVPQQNFDERLYIDYRHFDKYNIEPRYEFGFGLSYTSFAVSNLKIKQTKIKSAFPSPRPIGIDPPSYDESIPPPSDAVFPDGFKIVKKYIYPYINSEQDVKKGPYPYPDGYETKQPLSQAGGGEGGNPSLWDVYAEVEVTLSNTGSRFGQEVLQLYVSFPDNVVADDAQENRNSIDFPVKVLRGFEKVALDAGRSTTITFSLTRKDLSYWSVVHQNWIMPTAGKFQIHVGTSSRHLPLRGSL